MASTKAKPSRDRRRSRKHSDKKSAAKAKARALMNAKTRIGIAKREATKKKNMADSEATTGTRAPDWPLHHRSRVLESSNAAVPAVFHLFPQLPPELQLLIWGFWREGEPGRPGRPLHVRHYLLLSATKGRLYAAVDPTWEWTITARQAWRGEAEVGMVGAGPVWPDPEVSVVRLASMAGRVEEEVHPGYGYGSRFEPPSKRIYTTWARPLHAQVDFARDVFMLRSKHRLPGQLRWLLKGIGARMPPPMAGDHWARHIQRLAIWHPVDEMYGMDVAQPRGPDSPPPDVSGFRLAELDEQLLLDRDQLPALRTVYLVLGTTASRVDSLIPAPRSGGGNDGLVPIVDFTTRYPEVSIRNKVYYVGIMHRLGQRDLQRRLNATRDPALPEIEVKLVTDFLCEKELSWF